MGTSTISTGPFSIAFCMFTRGYKGFHEDFMFFFDVFVGDLWDRQGIEWYFSGIFHWDMNGYDGNRMGRI